MSRGKLQEHYSIQTYFKGSRTLRNILVSPKDKDPMEYKSGIIYWYRCQEMDCDDEYIEESAKTFSERCKEHLKASSPIHCHHSLTDNPTTLKNFSVVGREGQGFIMKSIWDGVLNNTPELKSRVSKSFNIYKCTEHDWHNLELQEDIIADIHIFPQN